MKKIFFLLACISISAMLFTSCDPDALDKDNGGSTSSESDGGGADDASEGVSFTLPDALIGSRPSDEGSYVRLVVEMRSTEEGGMTYRYSETINLKALYSVEIPEVKHGNYDIYAWADCFSTKKDVDAFYNVEDLSGVSFDREDYPDFDVDSRHAYYVCQSDVKVDGKKLDIDMKRPHAGYTVTLQNPEQVLEVGRGGYTASVRYVTFLPSGFNVYRQLVNDSATDVSYTISLPVIEEDASGLCIAKDIVLCGVKESSVMLMIQIKDNAGDVVYESETIDVSLKNGTVTDVPLEVL